MANKRISSLDDITLVGGTSTAEVNANDILPITDVDDTTGSAQGTTKAVKVSDLMGEAPVQSVAGRTGAVTIANTDVSGLGTAATTASTDYATAAHTHALDDLSDVSVSSPSSQDVVKWTGSQWEAGQVSVDVDTPLNTALRGTVNPHIGAYPNQSFKVTDNPNKSVMVIADADGNLDFLVKSDTANIYLNTPSARKAASFGFSVVEDASEPDIEVASGGENYSVISGDSDTKGANGLPIRQGFNNPDIGANPAPILISGGSIA
jgi:hypothetical protein